MGINLSKESVPDETTLLHFRHLFEKNGLAKKMFEAIRNGLKANGYMMTEGTVVDATIITAPSSTKNKDRVRDPEMSSTKKGNNHYFGMKCLCFAEITGACLVKTDRKNIHSLYTNLQPIHNYIAAFRLQNWH